MLEGELLQHIYSHNPQLPGHVVIPPGDDMGAITIDGKTVLITVDQIADGVHVNVANTPLIKIARKVIVRNLSDVAAMAALPTAAVAAACLPRDFGKQQADMLFDAMAQIAGQYKCPLIGGDISVWDHPLLLTVTVLAEPAGVQPVLRSEAQVGDVIMVSGRLGGAWNPSGGGAHLDAEPRILLARQLAEQLGGDLHSMIDLSDGLASDLGHICEQSDVAATIEETSIPCRDGVNVNGALTDGEDYELCFTMMAAAADKLPANIAGVPITRIGHIMPHDDTEPSRVRMTWADGSTAPITETGWEHGR